MSLTIKQCREILGKHSEKMSDEEIESLKNIFMAISDLAIDAYLEKVKRE